MKPYYQDKWLTIYYGDCREILPQLDKGSAIVTDPPYELGFMGKSWDSKGISFQKETWGIIRNSCLPGAPLLSFGGTRTFHRIACAIEDAGWVYRDTAMWVYGSGFPKSLDISKAIDKNNRKILYGLSELQNQLNKRRLEKGLTLKEVNRLFGVADNSGCAAHKFCDKSQPQFPTREQMKILDELLCLNGELWELYDEVEREIIGFKKSGLGSGETYAFTDNNANADKLVDITAPATPEAQLWNGYGTALKPAYEPIILAMNPLDGTFANNALKHGVAGLNIDECRIPTDWSERPESWKRSGYGTKPTTSMFGSGGTGIDTSKGRFPANFIHDGSQMVMELFPNSKGAFAPVKRGQDGKSRGIYGDYAQKGDDGASYYGDNGSAARFFYCAKASKAERDRGCEEMPEKDVAYSEYREAMKTTDSYVSKYPDGSPRPMNKLHNNHPTVKPLALMTYLVKLVKMPEYNLIIDPFCGSGTTLLACIRLGIPCIGIDNDEKSCEIATKRCCQEVVELV